MGDFENVGREWQLKGDPEAVRVHDFEIRQPDKGKENVIAEKTVLVIGATRGIGEALSHRWTHGQLG